MFYTEFSAKKIKNDFCHKKLDAERQQKTNLYWRVEYWNPSEIVKWKQSGESDFTLQTLFLFYQ